MSSGPGAPTSPSPLTPSTLPLAGSADNGSLHVEPFMTGEQRDDNTFSAGAGPTEATARSEFQHGMTRSIGR